MSASRIPRARGIWLAGLVALSLLTFGILPHASAPSAVHLPGAPLVQTASHADPVVFTRAPSTPVHLLKTAVPYGDLAVATLVFGLAGWLLATRPGRSRRHGSRDRGPRSCRAPPLAA